MHKQNVWNSFIVFITFQERFQGQYRLGYSIVAKNRSVGVGKEWRSPWPIMLEMFIV